MRRILFKVQMTLDLLAAGEKISIKIRPVHSLFCDFLKKFKFCCLKNYPDSNLEPPFSYAQSKQTAVAAQWSEIFTILGLLLSERIATL